MEERVGTALLSKTRYSKIWKMSHIKKDTDLFDQLLDQLPEERGFVRFVVISDTHCKHKSLILPKGDVLIHCGDFCKVSTRSEVKSFSNWLAKQPFKRKIVIAGNHEFTFDLEKEKEFKISLQRYSQFNPNRAFSNIKEELKDCIYLEDKGVEIYGYKIYGTPWHPPHLWGAFQRNDDDRIQRFTLIPSDTDILITHGPPYGHLDVVRRGKIHVGDKLLAEEVFNRIRPIIHLFGHIHEAAGIDTNYETILVNAASCSSSYKLKQGPVVFDLPIM